MGAATGLGVAFLDDKESNNGYSNNGYSNHDNKNDDNVDHFDDRNHIWDLWNENRDKILTVALFTAGGVLAGSAVRKLNKKKKGK